MKKILLSLMVIAGALSGCHDNDGKPATNWGINSSGIDKSVGAAGSINHQNDGPKVTYVATSSYVLDLHDKNLFQVTFHFTSADSLRLIIAKNTNDYNYHFPAAVTENQLLFAIFDRDTLAMNESALAVQPQPSSNTFSTVTNLHTIIHGDFNGTINNVVLVSH